MNNTLGLYNFVRGFRGAYQNGEAYKPCVLITVIKKEHPNKSKQTMAVIKMRFAFTGF